MENKITIFFLYLLLVSTLATCGPTPSPVSAPDARTSASAVADTAAEIPTATGTPTPYIIIFTATPSPSATPSDTPLPSKPTNTPTPVPTSTPGSAGVDLVVAYNPGSGVEAEYGNPRALLGDPDLIEEPCCQGMLQLGKRGSVLLAFMDNSIVDGDGPDFQVYGESAEDDYLLIEVSADGQTWHAYPKVSESAGALDLVDVGLTEAVYVRLTDLQPGTPTGAEVDAVIALHSGPEVEDGLLPLPDAVARKDLTLREGPSTRMKKTGQAPVGAILAVLGRSEAHGWAKVETENGDSGWCLVVDLALNVSLSDYPIASAPPTPTPKPLPTPTATPTPTLRWPKPVPWVRPTYDNWRLTPPSQRP